MVTWNSARFLEQSLAAIRDLSWNNAELLVVDNRSADGTRDILRRSDVPTSIAYNDENRGFAAGQNQAIAKSSGDVILALNPDVLLTPSFVAEVVGGLCVNRAVGMVAPKLLRTTHDFELPNGHAPVIDSAGLYLTRALRHMDRGAGEHDRGQYDRCEWVFGASGAAALYTRDLVEDVKLRGEFFGEMFFAYREDVDLAWRARLLGWECVYVPRAVAYHWRRIRPNHLRRLPPDVKYHSVKNRFLMRIRNMTPDVYFKTFLLATARDAVVLGSVVLTDWACFRGLGAVVRALPTLLEERQEIQSRRRPGIVRLTKWVSHKSLPLAEHERC